MGKIIHTLSQQTYNHQMPPKIISNSEFGLHFQQVEYSSIVGLMFDIHHFGFCSSGCLFFDADRLFRAVASPYFALDDAYTPHLLARLLCE
jgi:hypothetical protein